MMLRHVAALVILVLSPTLAAQRPNIIIIVGDDLGWDDVGFHGSDQIPTPNLDRLAREGIILNNYYVHQMCTPTRSALMTGRYPTSTGLQHGVIVGSAPYGLGLQEKILPQYLKELGYMNHIVGKWHLGFFAKEYTPTYRGFDSHFGYWLGAGDYWDHTAEGSHKGEWGLDFRRNMDVAWDAFGQYSTELFTNESISIIKRHDKTKPLFLYLAQQAVHSANVYMPLEAPERYVKRVSHIKNQARRTFAAMTVAMDDSVGAVVGALNETGLLNNSIILFTSDNGGPTNHYDYNVASNWPLRGMKATLWEGGLRVPAFIWSPTLQSKPRVSHQLLTVTDWLPTLLSAVGAKVTNTSVLDGVNQWTALSQNQPSQRSEILHNIDFKGRVYSLRVKDFKLISPNWASKDRFGWYKPESFDSNLRFSPRETETEENGLSDEVIHNILGADIEKYTQVSDEQLNIMLDQASKKYGRRGNKLVVDCGPKPPDASTNCQPHAPCLYHIPSDPCEYHNLQPAEPDIAKLLFARVLRYKTRTVPPRNIPEDPAGFPSNNQGLWRPWVTLK